MVDELSQSSFGSDYVHSAEMTAQVPTLQDERGIFVAGVMQRSGTNFLADLLALHPDCEKAFPAEDFFLTQAPLLEKYVAATYAKWNPRWYVRQVNSQELLLQSLGRGLLSFLSLRKPQEDSEPADLELDRLDRALGRIIAKTPSAQNLDYVFKLFPKSSLIIIVRDGRAAVESALRTFRWHFEDAVRRWAEGAREIVQFDKKYGSSGKKYLIVRYEDLNTRPHDEISRILDFLDLDAGRYDFEKATGLPVRGSSTFREDDANPWHRPKEKSSEFNPLNRFDHWDRKRRERFDWIAGEYLEAFGYNRDAERRAGYQLRQFGGDVRYSLTLGLRHRIKNLLLNSTDYR